MVVLAAQGIDACRVHESAVGAEKGRNQRESSLNPSPVASIIEPLERRCHYVPRAIEVESAIRRRNVIVPGVVWYYRDNAGVVDERDVTEADGKVIHGVESSTPNRTDAVLRRAVVMFVIMVAAGAWQRCDRIEFANRLERGGLREGHRSWRPMETSGRLSVVKRVR